jgi:hypothetical protein
MNNIAQLQTKTIDYCTAVGINPIEFAKWLNYIKQENQINYLINLNNDNKSRLPQKH